ncbi:MAG: N-acetyltransferase family protein [Candidatus Limnocylindria bacterium]
MNAANGIDEMTSVAELENWLGHTTASFDPSQDVVLADVDGELVGYAWVAVIDMSDGGLREFRVGGYVHPDWQGRGIGRSLLAWQEDRARAHPAAATSDRPLVLGTFTAEANASKIRLFTHAGYEVARYFFEMRRAPLNEVDVPPMPEGLEIRPVSADRAGMRQVWDADVEAFADHWGGFDASDAAFEAWLVDPYHDPRLWVVGWDGDEVAGAVTNAIFTEENEAFGRKRGWLETVFVRRAWRRRGLGAALVTRALVRLREEGMEEAMLGVDSDNPSGALALYEKAGFEIHRRSVAYRKPMELAR